jgi:hypothetical protein
VEADRELLTDLAVAELDHMMGVGVDAHQSCDLHLDAGLLEDLAHDRLCDGLTNVLSTAWQSPEVVVRATLEEDVASLVANHGRDGDDYRVRSGSVWVVVVLGSGH